MYSRLVQEYKIWLNELLEILERVCENVVPVGRLDEDIYWRTKELRTDAGVRTGQLPSELLQYVREGRELIAPLREAIEVLGGEISEEDQIRLRRTYANRILNSLQMLVNSYCIGNAYFQYAVEDVEKYFEVDVSKEVRRVRSGACVRMEFHLQEERVLAVSA